MLSLRRNNRGFIYALSWGFILALLLILPAIVRGGGILYLTNDFSTQQHPFYHICHEAIRNKSNFSSLTGLGTGLVTAYSFYTLGSPFFLFTLLFPSSFLPYLMGPLMIIKFSLSSLTAYIFLKRYVKDFRFAVLGALLYAFSGYQLFNIFYNHFEDVCVFAPLLLWSLDELMEDKKGGAFLLCVFINATVNYIFFVGSVVFVVIYFIIKVITKQYKLTCKRVFRILIESVLGFLLSSGLILPSVLSLLSNTRISEGISGLDALIYDNHYHYFEIIKSIFFPSDTPHIEPYFRKTATRWTEPNAYLAFFGVTGIIGTFLNKKDRFLKILYSVTLVFMLIPILNSVFSLFNAAYYARWFYFPVLMFSLGTVILLDNSEENKEDIVKAARIGLIITSVLSAFVLFFPIRNSDGTIKIGLFKDIDIFFSLFYIVLALISYILIILHFKNPFNKERLAQIMIRYIAGAVLLIGTVNITMMCLCYPASKTYKQSLIDGNIALSDNDDSYRIDASAVHYNVHMWWDKSALSTFNSTINPNETSFYNTLGYDRFVATALNDCYYAIKYLTSVKYAYYDIGEECLLPGFFYKGKENGFDVYENEYFIPMGFYYDNYITVEDFNEFDDTQKDNLLLKALILDDEQILKYGKHMGRLTLDYFERNMAIETSLYNDAMALREHSGYLFEWTNNGFISKIDLDNPKLVFYSIPYDKGFKAYVNGTETEIECVDGGMMAVYCPAGDNEIEFVYHTVGLKEGLYISLFTLIVSLVYLLLSNIKRKNKTA